MVEPEKPKRLTRYQRAGKITKAHAKKKLYYSLLLCQGGRCAICGNLPTIGRRLSIDHNHKTGEVRGLLCFQCNTAIGKLDVDEGLDVICSAISYLKQQEKNKVA